MNKLIILLLLILSILLSLFFIVSSTFIQSACSIDAEDSLNCQFFQMDILDKVEALGEEEQECLVNQVLEDDCNHIKRKQRIVKLELEKAGDILAKKQTQAAYKLGKFKVLGEEEKSIYRQVTGSLEMFPAEVNISLTDDNFNIFTKSCVPSIKASYWQRFTNIYEEGNTIVVFNKLEGSCFNISQLQSDYTILTEQQVDHLASQKKTNIQIKKFFSWEEANLFAGN